MNLKNLNEGFDRKYRITEGTEEVSTVGNSDTIQSLSKALQSAYASLQAKYTSNIKEYETAFQDAIEKQFPGKSWWEVTDCNIFWSLFNNHDPQKTITDILSNLLPGIDEEAVISESINPLEGLKSNIIEFPNGEYVYIGYEDGKLFAGSATNTGIIHEFEIDYDRDASVDENIGELYDTIVENNPSFLTDNLGVRKKSLVEGPGAGYEISANTSAETINKFHFDSISVPDEWGNAEVDCTCDITSVTSDFIAESHGYSTSQNFTTKALKSEINSVQFSVELEDAIGEFVDEDTSFADLGTDYLLEVLNSHINELSDGIINALQSIKTSIVYGGGWSHSTYDGTITDSDYDSAQKNYYTPFELYSVSIALVDKETIDYIDRAVSGENEYEVFFAVLDNVWEEGFDTEEEAIAYAKENNYDKVIRTYETEDSNGDVGLSDYSEVVWENDFADGVDESLKADKNHRLRETSGDKRFKIGNHDIQTVKVRNPYNYTVQELRIDNPNKTFERGDFSMGRADKELKNKQEFEDIVDELISKGYTEIKGDYRSLRNKTRKGVASAKNESASKKKIDLFINGEYVCSSNRYSRTSDFVDKVKKDGKIEYEGMKSNGKLGTVTRNITDSDKVTAAFAKINESCKKVNESKRGFVKKYCGCSIHDAGDVYVVTDEHGTTIGQSKMMTGAESIAEEHAKKTGKKCESKLSESMNGTASDVVRFMYKNYPDADFIGEGKLKDRSIILKFDLKSSYRNAVDAKKVKESLTKEFGDKIKFGTTKAEYAPEIKSFAVIVSSPSAKKSNSSVDESFEDSTKYLEGELASKTSFNSIKNAYERNDLTIIQNGNAYYFERCPNSIINKVKSEMKKFYPELRYLYDDSIKESNLPKVQKQLARADSGDKDIARDLALVIENDGDVYRQSITPIINNLKRKKAKGNFDKDIAVQAFVNAVNMALRNPKFDRYYSYSIKNVDVPTRYMVAKELCDYYMDEIDYNESLKESSEGHLIVDDVNAFKKKYPKGWIDNGKYLILAETTPNRHKLDEFGLLDVAEIHENNMTKRNEYVVDYSVPYVTWSARNPKKVTESSHKKITESVDSEDKKKALADYLGVDVSTISDGYDDYIFETEDGEEYIVADEDEAHDLAEQGIEQLFDDLGFESITPDFQSWIIDNALDTNWFDEAMTESYEAYAEDIESEGSNTYDNRLIEEMYDAGILTDDDFITDDTGDIDYSQLTEDVDLDSKREEFVEYLCNQYSDSVEWYRDNFGDSDLPQTLKDNPSIIDMDSVVEEAISVDGVSHFIASYDGDEIELDNGLFAYRTN